MNRLLILPCSATKDHALGKLPAIDRYQGPLFQTLRARLDELPRARDGYERDLRIRILSARFGFIAAHAAIPDYDQRLDQDRARTILAPWHLQHDWDGLKPGIMAFRRDVRWADEIGVVAGELYRDTIRAAIRDTQGVGLTPATYATGGIGDLRAALGAWMRERYA